MKNQGIAIAHQTLKHIEEGIRPLPGLLGGPEAAIGPWMQVWMVCAGASESERNEVKELLMRLVLGQFGDSLPD